MIKGAAQIIAKAAVGIAGAMVVADVVNTETASSSNSSFVPDVVASSPPNKKQKFTQLNLENYSLDHHLLHTSLAGEGKLEDYRIFVGADAKELHAHACFGEKACGHPKTVHGGAIASLFDDAMGTLFLSSKSGHGYTANLNIDYRTPIPAGTPLFLHAYIDRIESSSKNPLSKKIYVKSVISNRNDSNNKSSSNSSSSSSSIEDDKNDSNSTAPDVAYIVYAEATALFVAKTPAAKTATATKVASMLDEAGSNAINTATSTSESNSSSSSSSSNATTTSG